MSVTIHSACQEQSTEAIRPRSCRISSREVARIIGKTKVTVWRWAKRGKLKGHVIADRIFVSRRQVERIVEQAKR